MNKTFYDVVVLGRNTGSLLAATLLVKRGFRVLVLGQGDLPPSYELGPRRLPRRPFAFDVVRTPIARQVFSELALHPMIRRRVQAANPLFHWAFPGQRLDLSADPEQRAAEISREFTDVQRVIEDYERSVERAMDDLDELTQRELTWPPEGFFERREFRRATAQRAFERNGDVGDPLQELPEDHPYRVGVAAIAQFGDHIEPGQGQALRRMRHHGHWLRGIAKLADGEQELQDLLIERLTSNLGEYRPDDRADGIESVRNAVRGVRLQNSGDEVGCTFVVAGCSARRVLGLLPDRRPFADIFERLGEPQ
ncbi:MAG: hypothetical protein AAGF12_36285, partial [Myxococcota bacterium]